MSLMMQSNLMQQRVMAVSAAARLQVTAHTKVTASGHLYQVRNHVKMYPWRFNRTRAIPQQDAGRTPYTDKYNLNEFLSFNRKRKEWQKFVPKDKEAKFNAYHWNDAYRSDPKEAHECSTTKFNRLADSLRDRGYARERKPYTPPSDVEEKILGVCKSIGLQENTPLDDRELKFNFISSCIDMFDHEMPSSFLNDVHTVADVIDYFSTKVVGINPYDNLVSKSNDLPPNLTILAEPHRWNKESDQYFGGHSALPGTIIKVSGLRGTKKYPTLNQDEFQWPDI